MQLPAAVTVPDTVLWQQVGDEVVLVDLVRGEYHALDDIGSAIWQAFEECPDVATALERMHAQYDVDEDRLAHDVEAFVEQLLSTGLLVTR
jgi:hypothetical protein